jgi:hypothetical protein
MERQGFMRVEVNVRKDDAGLVAGLPRHCQIPSANPRRTGCFSNGLASRPR